MEQSMQFLTNTLDSALSEKTTRKIPVQFDPKSCESIICIELKNNNHLYLRYKDEWTIREVFTFLLF